MSEWVRLTISVKPNTAKKFKKASVDNAVTQAEMLEYLLRFLGVQEISLGEPTTKDKATRQGITRVNR